VEVDIPFALCYTEAILTECETGKGEESGVGTISVLADISAVLVILEFMVLATVPLVALYVANRGMQWLNAHLRPWLRQVSAGVNRVRDAVGRGSQLVAKPFVGASVSAAQVRGLFRGVGKALSGRS
jgi:hypothetical protein